jgi:hypothetical protein
MGATLTKVGSTDSGRIINSDEVGAEQIYTPFTRRDVRFGSKADIPRMLRYKQKDRLAAVSPEFDQESYIRR